MPNPPPATVAIISGTWLGDMRFTAAGAPNKCFATRAILQQVDRTITGDWVVTAPADNRISGEISGTLEGVGTATRFSGTVTWKTEIGTGSGACVGQSTFTGRAALPQLEWEAPDVQFRNCSDPNLRNFDWRMRMNEPPPCASSTTGRHLFVVP